MTTDALHPDHLQAGHMVGPWRILEPLGSGGFGRTFKVECEGALFSLKMALRPASEDKEVEGRTAHESAALLANSSHPNLPRVHAVGRWPHPGTGYIYFVTEYVEGETFNDWRARIRPTAAQLVDIFLAVVRGVVELHRRQLLHRDLTGSNIVLRKGDDKPYFIDLGSVWLPGSSTLTEKLPPSMAHTLPPECVSFLRRSANEQGSHFDAGEAGDLYQLGVFMFEALTEHHPFSTKLPAPELFAAIETVVPRPPHYLNPEVPESLSRIVMRLLEKRPEARYESAEALHQALWEAAKERKSRGWKVPLVLPASGPPPVTQQEMEDRRARQQESEQRAQEALKQEAEVLSDKQALEKIRTAAQEFEAELVALEEAQARRSKRRWRVAAGAGALVLGLALFAAWQVWLTPATTSPEASEKGSSLMSPFSNSRPVRAVAAWLCATFAVGCPAAQVRPLPGDCAPEAVRSMEQLNLLNHDEFKVIIDINQPGNEQQEGTYRPGPIVSKVVKYPWTGTQFPEGTLLYGQLWTEGLTKYGQEAVLGRYTEVLLPDGRRFPVCFVLGDYTGLTIKNPGSKPGEARLPREWDVLAVRLWP